MPARDIILNTMVFVFDRKGEKRPATPEDVARCLPVNWEMKDSQSHDPLSGREIRGLVPVDHLIYTDEQITGGRWRYKTIGSRVFPPARVSKYYSQLILRDGHHRADFASKLGYKYIAAFVYDTTPSSS